MHSHTPLEHLPPPLYFHKSLHIELQEQGSQSSLDRQGQHAASNVLEHSEFRLTIKRMSGVVCFGGYDDFHVHAWSLVRWLS